MLVSVSTVCHRTCSCERFRDVVEFSHQSGKALCAEDLPPNAHAGVRASLALMHNVVTGLALEYEHLTDLGA